MITEKLLIKLPGTGKANRTQEVENNHNDFKLDIRVAKVVNAEPVKRLTGC